MLLECMICRRISLQRRQTGCLMLLLITWRKPNQTVQRTGASRFAQRQIERHRRLAPVADLYVKRQTYGATPDTTRHLRYTRSGCLWPIQIASLSLDFHHLRPDNWARLAPISSGCNQSGWMHCPRTLGTPGPTGLSNGPAPANILAGRGFSYLCAATWLGNPARR